MQEDRARVRWDHLNSERLRKIYNFCNSSKTSKMFFETIASMFGEGVTPNAVRRQCQKMGFPPKVSEEISFCQICKSEAKVKGLCMKHYKSKYFQEVYSRI